MRKKLSLTIVFLITLALGAAIYVLFHQKKEAPKYTGAIEKLIIGTVPNEALALVFIAHDKGYFTDYGLEVTIKDYAITKDAFNDFFSGVLDMTMATEFSAVDLAFKEQDFKILGSIDEVKSTYIIGRVDHGILTPADFENKKIGVTSGITPEFTLGKFLLFNQIDPAKVTIVDMRIEDIIAALYAGEIDAGVIWDPFASQVQKSLKDNAVTFRTPLDKDSTLNIFGRPDFIKARPLAIQRFMQALLQAEKYIDQYPTEAKKLIAKRFDYESDYMTSVWSNHHFKLNLSQSLILFMEDEARWMMSKNMTNKTEIPNYLDFIDMSFLETLKPEAVSIIR